MCTTRLNTFSFGMPLPPMTTDVIWQMAMVLYQNPDRNVKLHRKLLWLHLLCRPSSEVVVAIFQFPYPPRAIVILCPVFHVGISRRTLKRKRNHYIRCQVW